MWVVFRSKAGILFVLRVFRDPGYYLYYGFFVNVMVNVKGKCKIHVKGKFAKAFANLPLVGRAIGRVAYLEKKRVISESFKNLV